MRIKKFSGTGNTFLVVWRHDLKNIDSGKIRALCEKFTSDGLVAISFLREKTFKWDFYNRDGSSAELCGNALRTVGKFLMQEKPNLGPRVFIETFRGVIEVECVESELFRVSMPVPKLLAQGFEVEGFKGAWINSGVPHFVIALEDYFPENINRFSDQGAWRMIRELSQRLRSHASLGTEGANITWFSIQRLEAPGASIWAVSFERGVEDFTLACGTGAVASAYLVLQELEKSDSNSILVEMPGGTLTVEFGRSLEVSVSGEAHFIGEWEERNISGEV